MAEEKKKSSKKTKTSNKKVNTKTSSKKNVQKKAPKVESLKQESKVLKDKKETLEKTKKQLYYTNNVNSNDEMTNLIKIVLIVTGIILIFYGVTKVVTQKANEAKIANADEAEIQYDEIIIGSMLNINGSYYVLIEDENDSRISEYEAMLTSISANTDAPKVYKADLSSSFNSDYLAKESNYSSNIEEFKVTGTTLVKISDHKIEETFDTYDSISSKLNELE